MQATVIRDSNYCTCLGHLGRRDTDRIISIVLSHVAVADGFANNPGQCKQSINATFMNKVKLTGWLSVSAIAFHVATFTGKAVGEVLHSNPSLQILD